MKCGCEWREVGSSRVAERAGTAGVVIRRPPPRKHEGERSDAAFPTASAVWRDSRADGRRLDVGDQAESQEMMRRESRSWARRVGSLVVKMKLQCTLRVPQCSHAWKAGEMHARPFDCEAAGALG